MNYSTPGFPVFHSHPEFAQTHVHWVNDALQPSQPLPPASPLALHLSHPQGLFQWVISSCQMARVLELKFQHQSFQGWFPLGLTGLISLQFKGLSRVFSSTTVWKHQFFSAQPFLWSNFHILTCGWKNHSFDYTDLSAKWCLRFLILIRICKSRYSSLGSKSFTWWYIIVFYLCILCSHNVGSYFLTRRGTYHYSSVLQSMTLYFHLWIMV